MGLALLKRVGRNGLSKFGWYQRLGDQRQTPAPAQPLAHEPFVLRLHPPIPQHHEQTRDPPYILRGRNEEMSEIASRLFTAGGSLSVVEGPPGIGKTSLMRAIGQYAENQGFAWIQLDPLDLCSLERFNRAVLRINPAQEWRSNPWQGLRNRFELGRADEFEFVGGRASSRLERSSYATLRQAIGVRSHARGILITIDDGRGALDHYPTASLERVTVGSVLGMFNDGLQVGDQLLPVQAIVSGTTGTVDEVQRAMGRHLAEDHSIVLDRVPYSSVRAVIEDCLRIADPASEWKPAEYPGDFLQECTERCHGHPLHAAAIGRLLQKLGLEFTEAGRVHATPADMAKARQKITARMEDSYRTRSRNIAHRDAEIMCDLVRAIARWGPRIGIRSAERLVQESGRRAMVNSLTEGDENQPGNWLDHLCNKGLVVMYESTTRYPRMRHMKSSAAYAEVDLPSFATYFAAQQTRAKGMLSDGELAELVPPEDRQLPAWDWPEAGTWHAIEQLAPPPLGNPYALEPVVPGDHPEPASVVE